MKCNKCSHSTNWITFLNNEFNAFFLFKLDWRIDEYSMLLCWIPAVVHTQVHDHTVKLNRMLISLRFDWFIECVAAASKRTKNLLTLKSLANRETELSVFMSCIHFAQWRELNMSNEMLFRSQFNKIDLMCTTASVWHYTSILNLITWKMFTLTWNVCFFLEIFRSGHLTGVIFKGIYLFLSVKSFEKLTQTV